MTDKEIFERDGFLEVPEIIIDPKNLFTKPPKNPFILKNFPQ